MEYFTTFQPVYISGCVFPALASGKKGKNYFHLGKDVYFRVQTSPRLILSTQWSKAAVK